MRRIRLLLPPLHCYCHCCTTCVHCVCGYLLPPLFPLTTHVLALLIKGFRV